MVGPGQGTAYPFQAEIALGNDGEYITRTGLDDGLSETAIRHEIRAEDVIYSGEGDINIAATLYLHDGPGPFPAIVMTHGSGRITRDLFWHQINASFFARNGLAVLIYDKRGVGESGGAYSGSADQRRLELLAQDAVAGVAYLLTRGEIHPDRIGVHGISQAGWINPLAASQSSDIAFFINISGPAVSTGEESAFSRYAGDGGGGEMADIDELNQQIASVSPSGYDPLPILMYHYISESPDPDDTIRLDLSVPPDMFEQQMAWLDDNGWTTITFYDFVEWLAEGVELPEKPIILTFDDGYRDNYENAFPVLEKYGQVGTFFVLTAPPEQGHPVYMSWDMLSEMSQAGQSIEMHAHDHFDLSGRDAAFLNVQIVESASIMEQRLGYRPRFLAYSGGSYDEGTIQALKDTDYWLAVTTQFGWLHSTGQEYELKRVRIHGNYSLAQFSGLLRSVFDE